MSIYRELFCREKERLKEREREVEERGGVACVAPHVLTEVIDLASSEVIDLVSPVNSPAPALNGNGNGLNGNGNGLNGNGNGNRKGSTSADSNDYIVGSSGDNSNTDSGALNRENSASSVASSAIPVTTITTTTTTTTTMAGIATTAGGGDDGEADESAPALLRDLSASEARNIFTALRKAANHPLLLRVRYQGKPCTFIMQVRKRIIYVHSFAIYYALICDNGVSSDEEKMDLIARTALAMEYFGKHCDQLVRVREELETFSGARNKLHILNLRYFFSYVNLVLLMYSNAVIVQFAAV